MNMGRANADDISLWAKADSRMDHYTRSMMVEAAA